MSRVPWIALILAAVAALNPIGLAFLDAAFLSSDQLGRNIAQPLVLMAAALLLIFGLVEWWIRRRRWRRRIALDGAA